MPARAKWFACLATLICGCASRPQLAASTAWSSALNDPDERVRDIAAGALATPDAAIHARLVTLLADLRGPDATGRYRAALQLRELGVVDEPTAAALLRAVRSGDMAVREGLVRAIERAHASRQPPAAILKETADAADDPATRAYARAALRELNKIGGAIP